MEDPEFPQPGQRCGDGALAWDPGGTSSESSTLKSNVSEFPCDMGGGTRREDSSSSEFHKLESRILLVGGRFREHGSTNQRKSGGLAAAYSEETGASALHGDASIQRSWAYL